MEMVMLLIEKVLELMKMVMEIEMEVILLIL